MGNQSIPVMTFRLGRVEPRNPRCETLNVMLAPNSSFVAGQVLGQYSGTPTNDVQTLTGNGTAGSFTLSYGGYTTSALSATATAAQVQAALQALASIGAGNVICTGGPLGTSPIVCTFYGALAALPITPMVVTNTTTTVTNAHTTTGIAGGRFTSYASNIVTAPATAPVPTASGSSGSLGAGTYEISYTYVTAAGESTVSPGANVTITAAQGISIAALTGLANGITAVNIYADGDRIATFPVSSNATAATVINALQSGPAVPAPLVSTAELLADGSQIPKGILQYSCTTDNFGNVTFSATTTVGEDGIPALEGAPMYYVGDFRVGDLTGLDAFALTQGCCRLIDGTSVTDVEATVRFY